MDKINIIVPCYNEQDVLEKFFFKIKEVMAKLDELEYKIIFIDDGSKDKTLEIIKNMAALQKCYVAGKGTDENDWRGSKNL